MDEDKIDPSFRERTRRFGEFVAGSESAGKDWHEAVKDSPFAVASPPENEDGAEIANGQGAREALSHHVRYSQPWQYDLMLLWAVQSYLRAVLPDECCVNLAFSGPKSSGKTKATQIAVRLAEGEMLGGGTLAAMIRTFDKAGVVGIDELDSNLKRLEDLEGILRVGTSLNAVYKICIPTKGGGQKPVDLQVGGPKVFNYRSDIEDALKSRCYVIEMPKQNEARLVVNNLFLANPTGRVTAWLKRICAEKLKAWTKAKVETHMKDEAFIARLKMLPAALARNRETAAIFLMIADILGWDVDAEMKKAVEVQADEETSNEDVKEILATIYGEKAEPAGSDLELPLRDVLAWVNERRKPVHPLSDKAFARIRRECGFQDGVNVIKRRSERGKRFLIFDKAVREALGVEPTNEEIAKAHGLAPSSDIPPALHALGDTLLDTIEDRVRQIVQWDPKRPDSWVAKDIMLRFQLPEAMRAELEARIPDMKERSG